MSKPESDLSPDQLRAIGALSGAGPAELDGLDAEAVAGWLAGDPEFIAGLNRAKSHRQERLRASLAILQAADAMKAETIGPTSAASIQASMDRKALIESLGG